MRAGPDVIRFRSVLAVQLGWVFDDNDVSQLAQVLRQRVDATRLQPAAYLRRLAAGDWEAELTALAEDLTINETYFFRHGEQFRALAEVVLPERLRDRYAQRVLRMLSVGCSSGEEAYTMGILAREAQPDPDWIVAVLGLDASATVLRRAERAVYSAWSLRETPDAIRERWFRPQDGEYVLDPRIRAAVRFRRYNVATDDELLWRAGQYDVIFCRNLLMYLTPELRETLVRRMTGALAPGGYLFLGHTDSLGTRPDGLEPQHTHRTFYYRRTVATAQPAPSPRPGPAPPRTLPPPAAAQTGTRSPYDKALGLLREERFAEALSCVEAGLGSRPAPRDLLLRSVLLAQAGRLEDAEIVCRRLLDTDGLYADAHHQLGVCLEGGAAVEVAVGHYRLAAYLDPAFAMPRLRLGSLARRRGEHEAAGAELERALTLLKQEAEDRLTLFGGGFGRIALTALCRAELDAGVRR
ncbi:CheR family methyltransferase [Actinoplanes sp. NPDC049548]|uniref:CheR family methyltransferase n=1 Tax=Actinoplanes sp. NPDC049548 TaxID=3155152 RepID=UPI003428995B